MKKLVVGLSCMGLLVLLCACTGVSKEDYEAQQSELQHMKEVQSGILAVLDMTEEKVIGYRNGTWDFPEPIIEPAAEAAPTAEVAEVELSFDGEPVTIELTVDSFTDYFAFALIPDYDVFGEMITTNGGTVRIRSINEQYKGFLPVFSDDFAVKARIGRDTLTISTSSSIWMTGNIGLLETTSIEKVSGSVAFYPIGMYELHVSGLKTDSPQYKCFVNQDGQTIELWVSYSFDLAFFMEENGIAEVEAQP